MLQPQSFELNLKILKISGPAQKQHSILLIDTNLIDTNTLDFRKTAYFWLIYNINPKPYLIFWSEAKLEPGALKA